MWALERGSVASEHSGLARARPCVVRARDDELVARRPVERVAAVGADLRGDAQRAQQRERAARDGRLGEVEVEDRSTPRPRRWTVPAVWNSAEVSASRSQRDAGAIAASSARASSTSVWSLTASTPSSASSRRFVRTSRRARSRRSRSPRRPGGTEARARARPTAQKAPAARAARGRSASARARRTSRSPPRARRVTHSASARSTGRHLAEVRHPGARPPRDVIPTRRLCRRGARANRARRAVTRAPARLAGTPPAVLRLALEPAGSSPART